MASSFPDWVMLDRVVLVSFAADDGGGTVPADDPTAATCANSNGDEFTVRLLLAAPPRPSRICLHWPGDGTSELKQLSVVAAHRGAVLLQMAYDVPLRDYDVGLLLFDYFLYTSSGPAPPSLLLLPPIAGETIAEARARIATDGYLYIDMFSRRFECLDVGVLCFRRRGRSSRSSSINDDDDEFIVAELQTSEHGEWRPCLNVYRPSSSPRWETIPVRRVRGQDGLDLSDGVRRRWNSGDTRILPFGSYLCWVDYRNGILLWNAFDDDDSGAADLQHLDLPLGGEGYASQEWLATQRSVNVVAKDGGSGEETMKFIDITCDKDSTTSFESSFIKFTVTIWTLKFTADDHDDHCNGMFWEKDCVVRSDELFGYGGYERIPRAPLIFPLVATDRPSVVYYVFHMPRHLVLESSFRDEVWLLAIDMSNKVVESECRYPTREDNPTPEEARFYDAKQHYFDSFIPSEFPKFLKLKL